LEEDEPGLVEDAGGGFDGEGGGAHADADTDARVFGPVRAVVSGSAVTTEGFVVAVGIGSGGGTSTTLDVCVATGSADVIVVAALGALGGGGCGASEVAMYATEAPSVSNTAAAPAQITQPGVSFLRGTITVAASRRPALGFVVLSLGDRATWSPFFRV
jgi:hypothetical protein